MKPLQTPLTPLEGEGEVACEPVNSLYVPFVPHPDHRAADSSGHAGKLPEMSAVDRSLSKAYQHHARPHPPA
jgi:hypothetical protein